MTTKQILMADLDGKGLTQLFEKELMEFTVVYVCVHGCTCEVGSLA